MSKTTVVITASPSAIINEGLRRILLSGSSSVSIYEAFGYAETERLVTEYLPDAVIVDPVIIVNRTEAFDLLRLKADTARWIALVHSFYDLHILSLFDGTININDSPSDIRALIRRLLEPEHARPAPAHYTLSERETDVLKLLVHGLSNKEIADKLNISIHTVISHRKNITSKTGIKSVSGLTIFAVSKNLISTEEF
jgi:DNA-binding CsgD family transcriptional regulator